MDPRGALSRRTRRRRVHGPPAGAAFVPALLLAALACHGPGGSLRDAWAAGPSPRYVTIGKPAVMPCVLRLLAPRALAAKVIGKGGAAIAELCQSTQAKVGLSNHDELYPGTECQVLTAQAHSEEALEEVSAQVIAKIGECVQQAGASESLGGPEELKLRVLMPRLAVSGIIGKGGAAIKELRERSDTKIFVGEASGRDASAEQIITITGSQQGLERVMGEVNSAVQALNSEAWFKDWAEGKVDAAVGGSHGAPASMALGQKTQQLVQIASQLPQHVMEDSRGFTLSCVVPNSLVGGLIGRGGAGIKEVQSVTNTKIRLQDIPGDPDNRSMTITGPVASSCTAYMLMMKKYVDAEEGARSRRG